jgi:hypothetical protein
MEKEGAFLTGPASDSASMNKYVFPQIEGASGYMERSASLGSLPNDDGRA